MIVNTRNLIGHTTGVQRYTSSILNELSKDNISYSEIQPEEKYSSGMKGHFWEQLILPLHIKKMMGQRKNILWSPSNTGPMGIEHQVVTIHDTVPFDHPEWLNSKFVSWYKFLQPILTRKVKHIITISEFSKNKIIEHLKVPEEKISVIYNGVDIIKSEWTEQTIEKYNHLDRYILSVGSLEPRKNINKLITAFCQYKNETSDNLKLVIVGKEGVGRVFRQSSIDKDNRDIIYTGHISDSELNYLYAKALGFCYPSMYEGFGLPPLEAMAHGIPVLTSDNSALKELCENRAILVNPYSTESIAEGIYNLINNNSDSIKCASNMEYANSLTWSKCARSTINLLNNI